MTTARDREQRNRDAWFPPHNPVAVPQPDPASTPHPWEDWDDWILPVDETPPAAASGTGWFARPTPLAPAPASAPAGPTGPDPDPAANAARSARSC